MDCVNFYRLRTIPRVVATRAPSRPTTAIICHLSHPLSERSHFMANLVLSDWSQAAFQGETGAVAFEANVLLLLSVTAVPDLFGKKTHQIWCCWGLLPPVSTYTFAALKLHVSRRFPLHRWFGIRRRVWDTCLWKIRKNTPPLAHPDAQDVKCQMILVQVNW